jgi:hypothetical protein
LRSILKYPSAYLHHRRGVFLSSIGLKSEWSGGLYAMPLTHSRYGDIEESSLFISHNYRLSTVQEMTLRSGAEFLNRTWLTVPAFYMGFLIIYLAFQLATAKGAFSPFFYLALSALLYKLTLFVLAPSSDFRYSHWTLYVSWLVLVIISVRILVRRSNQRKMRNTSPDQDPSVRIRDHDSYSRSRANPNPQ